MQTTPVISTAPIVAAKAPSQPDNSEQAAESFGNVLARQRANAAPADSGQSASKKGSASSSGEQVSSAPVGKEAAEPDQAQGKDAADSAIPADILAALLPGKAATDKTKPDGKVEKADPAVQAQVDTAVLPGAAPAMPQPAAAVKAGAADDAAQGKSTGDKKVTLEDIKAGDKASRQPDLAAKGEVKQQAAGKAQLHPEQALVDPQSPASRTHSSAKSGHAVAEVNAGKEKAFSAALEATARTGAKTAKAGVGLAKAGMQPDSAATAQGLAQNGAAPLTSTQNGPVQTTQAAINTPVAGRIPI